jgi:diguanylate cyclase (GGDEF)-like protein
VQDFLKPWLSRVQVPLKASLKGPPLSLRLLLTLPFVVQVAGAVGVVGYLSYRNGQQTIETMAYALMDQVGQRVTQELDHYLHCAHRFNQSQVAAIAAQAIDPQDLDHLHRYLILQHRQEADLTTLLFGTPQGDFRISHHVTPADYGVNTRLQPGEIPIEAAISEAANPSTNHLYGVDGAGQMGRYLETIDNMDVRDRPWYRQAIATGKPGWVGPYQLGSTNLLTLNAHAPVYDEGGDLLGVFAVNITLNQLGDFLANLEVGQSGEVIILERNGLVVATSTGEGPYALTSAPNANSRTPPGTLGFERLQLTDLANPFIQRAYESLSQSWLDLDSLRSPQAIHVEGPGLHYFITVVPYSDAYGLDWLVMTVIPDADFTAAIQQNLRKTVGLCLLALGGAIASGVLLSTWVTRQITRLTQASAALAAGDLTQQVPTTSPIVETKTLALAFNQMAVQLRQLFQHQVAAEAARQSEAYFHRLAAAVPGMIYTYTLQADGTTGFDYVSWASQSILELTPEQILADAETALAQIHPDDRPTHAAALAHSVATLEPFSLAFRNITPSGQLKWLEANSQPLQHKDSSITWYGLLLDVSDRKAAEAALQQANQQLEAHLGDLRQRNQDMVLLGKMNDCLQVCLTPDSAYAALPDLLQPLFPDCAGGIFTIDTPGGQVKAQATWGQPLRSEAEFGLADCWALRRGRGYWVPADQAERHCPHVTPESGAVTLCIPMLAQGEFSGLLYLSAANPAALPTAKRQLAHTVAEQVALSIANLQLRETLKEQSIRDPLTGLFNRRYLEESLQQEIIRAQRYHHSIGVIMIDIDHFKRVNDTYGHDAGDYVLKTMGQLIQESVRRSDIACRYGGEELTLILPGTALAEATLRAEALRSQISHLILNHHNQNLGTLTASFGVACFPDHGLSGAAVVQSADQALYQAKVAGRDRVMCALPEPA